MLRIIRSESEWSKKEEKDIKSSGAYNLDQFQLVTNSLLLFLKKKLLLNYSENNVKRKYCDCCSTFISTCSDCGRKL